MECPGSLNTHLISILQVLVKVAGANQKDVPSAYKMLRVLYFSIPPLNLSSALHAAVTEAEESTYELNARTKFKLRSLYSPDVVFFKELLRISTFLDNKNNNVQERI